MRTKLDVDNPHHQLLIACLADFVTKYGYTTRELYKLMNNAQGQLWSALIELEKEAHHE